MALELDEATAMANYNNNLVRRQSFQLEQQIKVAAREEEAHNEKMARDKEIAMRLADAEIAREEESAKLKRAHEEEEHKAKMEEAKAKLARDEEVHKAKLAREEEETKAKLAREEEEHTAMMEAAKVKKAREEEEAKTMMEVAKVKRAIEEEEAREARKKTKIAEARDILDTTAALYINEPNENAARLMVPRLKRCINDCYDAESSMKRPKRICAKMYTTMRKKRIAEDGRNTAMPANVLPADF
jgi:hypothetical protein